MAVHVRLVRVPPPLDGRGLLIALADVASRLGLPTPSALTSLHWPLSRHTVELEHRVAPLLQAPCHVTYVQSYCGCVGSDFALFGMYVHRSKCI